MKRVQLLEVSNAFSRFDFGVRYFGFRVQDQIAEVYICFLNCIMLLHYQIYRFTQLLAAGEIETPFQVGRQLPEEADLQPICISDRQGIRRLVFASRNVDRAIPRRAFVVDEHLGHTFVENTHETVPVGLADGRKIPPSQKLAIADHESFVFANGYRLWIGKNRPLTDEALEAEAPAEFRMLESIAMLAGSPISSASLGQLPSIDTKGKAIDLVKAALSAFREPPNSDSFYKTVVHSVIEMLDVDRAMVLVLKDGDWRERASASRNVVSREIVSTVHPVAESTVERGTHYEASLSSEATFSRSLLQRTLDSRRTTIVEINAIGKFSEAVAINQIESFGNSMQNIERAVASPIFDDHQEVIAILYADKRVDGFQNPSIGDLEASLLEVLASGVSNSLMRQRDQEFRSSAGQFFSPLMLDRLQLQKDLLAGRDAEVSVLFCDIRSFSKVSHTVGPRIAIAWVNDVLSYLSECVLRYDGVLVDYVGDELMAMFGAPEEQLDHADRACRAAVDMMRLVPHLDAEWREQVQEEFGICIGINSGPARVGNIGSRLKFKYGPLGSTVNFASRIERLAKSLRASAVIGGATAARISASFKTRHLTVARVAGIAEPVELFELFAENSPTTQSLCSEYEAALKLFLAFRLPEAIETLDRLLQMFPDDGPSLLLRNRALSAMSAGEHEFAREWTPI